MKKHVHERREIDSSSPGTPNSQERQRAFSVKVKQGDNEFKQGDTQTQCHTSTQFTYGNNNKARN